MSYYRDWIYIALILEAEREITQTSILHKATMSGSETPDTNRGPTVVAILWAETAVAAIIVAMRFCARTIIKKLSWDDWLMLVTLVSIVASQKH